MPATVDVLGDLQFEKKTVCDSFNRQHKGRKLRIQQKISNLPVMKFEQLREFRQLAYQCLGNAKDATFELADAAPDDPPHLMLRRFSPLIPYFGVSGRAPMKHYKTVDQSEQN
jgi:hypothetical protein